MEVSSDKEQALLTVRLCDLAPNGQSTLISWGVLNLTHRDSHEFPEKLTPGEKYTVTIPLNAIGYQVPKGHRLQIALAPTYWPHAWPSPEEATLVIYTGEQTKLKLPVRTPQELDQGLKAFEQQSTAKLLDKADLRKGDRMRKIEHDPITNEWHLIDLFDEGKRRLVEDGIEYGSINKLVYQLRKGPPYQPRFAPIG